MSEVKVNKISPRAACGTVTLGDSGDTFTIPSMVLHQVLVQQVLYLGIQQLKHQVLQQQLVKVILLIQQVDQ